MSKFTRAAFTSAVEHIWDGAKENFAKDHIVYNYLLLLDRRGHQQAVMACGEEDAEECLRRGIVPSVVPFSQNLDLLRDVVERHRPVAGVMLGEAWIATNDYARESLRMNIVPSEHPMREEVVFCVAMWPREYVSIQRLAYIVRDKTGAVPPRLDLEREPFPEEPGETVFAMGWLADLLPQPYN